MVTDLLLADVRKEVSEPLEAFVDVFPVRPNYDQVLLGSEMIVEEVDVRILDGNLR